MRVVDETAIEVTSLEDAIEIGGKMIVFLSLRRCRPT